MLPARRRRSPQIKDAIEKTYGKRGEAVVERNFAAVDAALAALARGRRSRRAATSRRDARCRRSPTDAPDFVQRVTAHADRRQGRPAARQRAARRRHLPDRHRAVREAEHRPEIPIWDPDICIQCGMCAMVCPHAAIRMKVVRPDGARRRAGGLPHRGRGPARTCPGTRLTIQVAPDDCTGCGVCVDVCPAKSKTGRQAQGDQHGAEARPPRAASGPNFDFFLEHPRARPHAGASIDTVKGSQLLEPLFEFSGACAGCGETPYLKLMSQLFGDRMIDRQRHRLLVDLRRQPADDAVDARTRDGRGPAWANSLFEDNAEFGLGMRLAVDQQASLRARPAPADCAGASATSWSRRSSSRAGRRGRDRARSATGSRRSKRTLAGVDGSPTRSSLAGGRPTALVRRSVWIVGGDGWAYDIGFGGLDHVLASGRDVNILVLDTEVYSNTGGQASKSTPRGAVAKFAAGGKATGKKDLGMIAVRLRQRLRRPGRDGRATSSRRSKAFREAESYPGRR